MLPNEDFRLFLVAILFLALLVVWTLPSPESFAPSSLTLGLNPPDTRLNH
jgi:hypothetical protein